jgi:hypothetical protein
VAARRKRALGTAVVKHLLGELGLPPVAAALGIHQLVDGLAHLIRPLSHFFCPPVFSFLFPLSDYSIADPGAFVKHFFKKIIVKFITRGGTKIVN